jgi:xylan 1,4-beta-xylosidase
MDSEGSSDWEKTQEQQAALLAGAEGDSFLDGLRALMPDKSETDDLPNDLMVRNAAVVRKQAGDLPLFYTEWNENAIFSAWTNDTRKVAAYDVKMALELGDAMDGSSIWCFSDIFEELHPFPQEFHGGFGMLTQNGIPKPVFHAMKMLADAGDERLDLGPDATCGEIGIAAFRKEKDTQILLFRQKMKNLDLPKEKAVVRLDMPARPAGITLRRVDENHGNPLRLWEEMGSPVSLNRAEVEALKEKSDVRPEAWPFAWEDGVLTLEAELGVNDVYFFEIQA